MRFGPEPITLRAADGTPVLDVDVEEGLAILRPQQGDSLIVDAEELHAALSRLLGY